MSSASVTVLYLLFALGAVGVYLALPGGRRSARTAGLIFGLGAIAGFVVLVAASLFPEDYPTVAFCLLAAAAIFGAAKVVTHPKPVYSAVYFVLVVLSVACLMVLQEAEFLGIALVIVYAGAILVTYLFVIMLAQQSGASTTDTRARAPLTAVLAGFVTMAAIAGQAAHTPQPDAVAALGREAPSSAADESPLAVETDDDSLVGGNTPRVGMVLFSTYVVALEIAGLLLLVALIGAVALTRKRVPRDVPVGSAPPLGQVGREAPPF